MIIPALDLLNNKIVRLYQGKYEQKTYYPLKPIAQLYQYYQQGAQWVHLVDLQGAQDSDSRQTDLIRECILHTPLNVQIGGGIRSKKQISELLNQGVKRVVLGSLAIQKPKQVQAWIKEFGTEKIVLALDVRADTDSNQYKIAISGWCENSNMDLKSLIEHYRPYGLRHVLCTDISRDGTLKGPNTDLYQNLSAQYPEIQFQASGGIASLENIQLLKKTKVHAAIIGRALLEHCFHFKEAHACWQKE